MAEIITLFTDCLADKTCEEMQTDTHLLQHDITLPSSIPLLEY